MTTSVLRYRCDLCGKIYPLRGAADWCEQMCEAQAIAAQGTEAATAAETVEQGSVHESPVGLGRCAQTAPKGAR